MPTYFTQDLSTICRRKSQVSGFSPLIDRQFDTVLKERAVRQSQQKMSGVIVCIHKPIPVITTKKEATISRAVTHSGDSLRDSRHR